MQLMCLPFVSDFPTKLRIFIVALSKIPKLSKNPKKLFIVYSKFPFGETLYRAETSQLILYVGCTVFSWKGILIKLSLLL